MNKSICVVFLFYSVVQHSLAQSEPQFTQHVYNRYLFNPAHAGGEEALEVSLLHRSQYVVLADKSISTQGFNINVPVHAISSGIGATVVNDLIGFQRATYVSLNYDYRKKFKWGKFALGIGAGFVHTSIDGSKLRTPDGNYGGGVSHSDALLPEIMQAGIAPDISFGVYINTDKYFVGTSINHIAFSYASINVPTGKSVLSFSRNLFLMGGYDFSLSRKLRIMPSVLLKTDFKKVQIDFSGTFTIIDNILTGISFRGYTKNTVDALGLILGFRYKGVQLVYSYDINVSYLNKFNAGSHEISVSYRYPLKKKESRGYFYHNPRYSK